MTRMFSWLLIASAAHMAALAPSAHAGKEPAEEFLVGMFGQLEKMAATLESMKDEASCAAGREELKKNISVYLDLRAKAAKLPPPPRELKERLAKEYKGKFVAIQGKLMAEVARVRGAVPGGRAALTEVIPLLYNKEVKGLDPAETKDKSPKEKGEKEKDEK